MSSNPAKTAATWVLGGAVVLTMCGAQETAASLVRTAVVSAGIVAGITTGVAPEVGPAIQSGQQQMQGDAAAKK